MQGVLVAILAFIALMGSLIATPLDDYVWRKDEAYGWVDMGSDYTYKGKVGDRGFTYYTLNMTSQRWLTDADFTADSPAKSLWWHYLVVIVPDKITHKSNATLWITGGSQTSGLPQPKDEDILVSAALATTACTVTGVLFQIPNEHTIFASDPIQKSRTEDAIIAYTWDHFLNHPDQPDWLVRFPMVKASIKAMDAITEFIDQKHPELGVHTEYFSVSGASKRGWTTWLVGAVDQARVKLIVPIVLDAINFVEVMHHQFRSYGGWSYALSDYIDMKIPERFDDPNMRLLQQYEDPYFYRHRLTMPKMVVNAAMDEFQQPDDTHYWWNDMPEPKHFLLAPNAEHSLATGILEVVPAIGAFIKNHLVKDLVPQLHWTISESTGEIVATLSKDAIVHSANVWWAYSCGENAFDNNKYRRDYRVAHLDNPCNCGMEANGYCANLKSVWQKAELTATVVDGKKTFSAKLDAPDDGRWVTFFLDFKLFNKNAFPIDIAQMYKEMKPNTEKTGVRFTQNYANDNFGGFPHDFGRFFEFTTEVSVWPNVFPYEDCHGVACGVRLV
jgi:PhoPQ-activated pathogenicity-related protein